MERTPARSSTRLRVSVVFPAPDGEDRMRMRPRRPTGDFESWLTASLHILNLLAELLDHGLQFKPDPRERHIIGLCTQGIGLAPEFLRQEIQASADRSALLQQAPRGIHVSTQPVE